MVSMTKVILKKCQVTSETEMCFRYSNGTVHDSSGSVHWPAEVTRTLQQGPNHQAQVSSDALPTIITITNHTKHRVTTATVHGHMDMCIKTKGFPYSLPSTGPGDDPGVQAVSPQVTTSHALSGRLPLLSARPAVIFPATEHHRPLAGTKLYCLVTEAHRCQQLA